MAIYPGAVFKPTGFGGKTARNKQGRGILHVAVSSARSLPPWNANTWHFYVAKDGYCEQYVDTAYRAYASGDANDDALAIETAGGLGTSAVLNAEPWTPAQVDRLADIMAWESKQPGGAPLDLLPDSKPGRRGWGPHRLGVQHSRGVGAVPGWLVAGGERWSSVLGKECPGNTKVAQIGSELIPLARRKAGGATSPGGNVMATLDAEDLAAIKAVVHGTYGDSRSTMIKNRRLGREEYPETIWGSLEDRLARGEIVVSAVGVAELRAEVAKLRAEGVGIDVDEVVARVTEGVSAKVLADVGEIVRDALGEDNAEQADAIVTKLATRLAS